MENKKDNPEFMENKKDNPEFMEIKINRKTLLSALANTKPITSCRHTLAILSSILISTKGDNEIEITATDLETGFQGVYSAKVASVGSIAISHKELNNFVSKIKSDEIHITEKEKGWINISGDSASCNIACMSADDFPTLPEEVDCKKMVEIDICDFRDMISKTVIVNPELDECLLRKKPFKAGVFFKTIKKDKQDFLQVASTNGSILSQINKKISIIGKAKIEKGVLISKNELTKLSRAFLKDVKNKKQRKNKGFELFEESSAQPSNQTVYLAIQGDFFIIQKQNEAIIIRLLEGKFPDYLGIINGEKSKFDITVDRKNLLDVMKRMASMQDENYKEVNINIETDILTMVFINPDIGEMKESITVQYNGESIEIVFRPNYFVDFLGLMKSDVINLNITVATNPCFITGDEDPEVIFLVMPCKPN